MPDRAATGPSGPLPFVPIRDDHQCSPQHPPRFWVAQWFTAAIRSGVREGFSR
jgi:hypothetical protein